MKPEEKTFYQTSNIPPKIIIIFFAGLVLLFLISGVFFYRFQNFSDRMINVGLEQKVLKHKLDIDYFFQEKLKALWFFSRNFEPEQFKNESFLQRKIPDLHESYGDAFLNLGFHNEQGNQVAYAGPLELENSFTRNREWFKKALEDRYVISDLFELSENSAYCMVAISMQEKGGRWILKSDIDVGPLKSILGKLESDNSAIAFILNRKGEFQILPPPNLPLNIEKYMNLFDKGTNVGKFDNNRRIIASTLVNDDNWLLIIEQNTDDAFSGFKSIRNIVILIILLYISGFIMVVLWLSGIGVNDHLQAGSPKDMVTRQIIESSSLDSIGELAVGIAHEINNPVAIMVEEAGWIQDLINEGIDTNEKKEEFIRSLQQIEVQGHRCKDITRKLLTFGKKTDMRVQNVQLNEVIEEVVQLSMDKARHAKVEIQTRLYPQLPKIRASIPEMHQVLLNLVNNALDAMEIKGDRIDISTRLDEKQVIIIVADNGPGIPAVIINRLFDPFFSTKPVGEGTGLGLSICYGIVTKMGGKIDFETMLDRGTTVRIILPVK
jgi:two-component system, NtrC family, sensor kinase